MTILDEPLASWRRRHEKRRHYQSVFDQINHEGHAAIQSSGEAFMLAQQLIRDECAAQGVRR